MGLVSGESSSTTHGRADPGATRGLPFEPRSIRFAPLALGVTKTLDCAIRHGCKPSATSVPLPNLYDTVFTGPHPLRGEEALVIALTLDVPQPDLTPVEGLLDPVMLDVVAGAALA